MYMTMLVRISELCLDNGQQTTWSLRVAFEWYAGLVFARPPSSSATRPTLLRFPPYNPSSPVRARPGPEHTPPEAPHALYPLLQYQEQQQQQLHQQWKFSFNNKKIWIHPHAPHDPAQPPRMALALEKHPKPVLCPYRKRGRGRSAGVNRP
jgi:hypothetical protein